MDFKTETQLRQELSDAWKLVDQYKRAEEYAAEWEKEQHAWKEAVINELVVLHIYNSAHDNDPRKAIQDAITYHCQIALDPQVSSDAQALVDRGRAEARGEIEAKVLDEVADCFSNGHDSWEEADIRLLLKEIAAQKRAAMRMAIDRRTALACAAIRAGIAPEGATTATPS